jgi:glycosyltransferase involved in cell wall biosynthesis
VALAGALRRLQNDPDLGNELARHAYDRVMNHYTWEVRARTILKTVSNRASTVTD